MASPFWAHASGAVGVGTWFGICRSVIATVQQLIVTFLIVAVPAGEVGIPLANQRGI